MAEYCQLLFDWTTEGDFRDVIDYRVQPPEQTDNDRNLDSSIDTHLPVFRGRLHLFSESKDGETPHICTLKLKCKPTYKVAIKGIDIVSEAKTVEVYDNIDGYLQSVKGVPVPECEQEHVFYVTSFQIRESSTNMELKFLSLGERLSFQVCQIRIILVEQEVRQDRSRFDMVRLRKHIAGLGPQVSDRAKSLFETMEQYQKNQQGMLGEVHSMLSLSSTSPNKQSSMPGFAGLLGAFSHLTQQQKNPLVESALDGTSKEDQEGSEKSDPSKLADTMLSSMMAGADGGQVVKSDDMYRFLHSVCSTVTRMRQKVTQENKEQEEMANSASSQVDPTQVDSTPAPVDPAVLTCVVNEIKAAEERIVRQVERQMVQMEERLTTRLDTLLQALQVVAGASSVVQLSTSKHSEDGIQLD